MARTAPIACVLLSAALLYSQQPQQETPEIARLVATGKLWGTVKYFHPYLAYRDLDWDKCLVDSLLKIRSAKDSTEYLEALRFLLDGLQDPATYAKLQRPQAEVTGASIRIEKRPDGTLIVSQFQPGQAAAAARPLTEAITSATRIVFDLRVPPGASSLLSDLLEDGSVMKLLTRMPIETAAQRSWVHKGLPPADQRHASGAYNTAFYTTAGLHLDGGPAGPERRLAFILNENSPLPRIGCALWAQGKATVLSESKHYRLADVTSATVPMGEGIEVVLRLSEPLEVCQMQFVTRDDALPQALASLSKSHSVPASATAATAPSPRPDQPYMNMRYPSVEYRLLAAYKIWAAFRNFFAYRDLMDEDWDDVFTTSLPKFIAAKDAREYNLTVAEMITHTSDSHALPESAELSDYFGQAPVGLRLQLIQRKPVITQVLDTDAVKAGVRAGDVVTRVDGESITDRFHREEHYIAASTRQWLGYAIMQRILNGPENSDAVLTIESSSGEARDVRLRRSSSYAAALEKQRSGDVTKLLAGNIGYADLDRLTPDQVDAMFELFRSTRAIIFDMRGRPQGTAWSIAPRLTDRKDVPAAIFNGPLSLSPDLPDESLTSSASYFFVQKLPATDKWKYKGKTIMLIDERTVSEAEQTGLFFEAANKTEFIGTPSAGANGDVTNFVVPGGITIWFSGHDVRHANGGALQRLGLQPSVTVDPTITGIRAGRDEVLQKALDYLTPAGEKGDMRHIAALGLYAVN